MHKPKYSYLFTAENCDPGCSHMENYMQYLDQKKLSKYYEYKLKENN